MYSAFNIKRFFLVTGILAILFSRADAQVRSGAAFLKMLPGARLQSMAGAHTAVLDDPHAIFANPGNAGYLREWQWAAGYTKWVADIYNASFMYGGTLPNPVSNSSRFAIGVLYQGVPEFNNNASVLPSASASDFVASLSVGQPLSFITDNVSIGTNLKYYKSTLAQYSAGSFAYDFGLTARTSSFKVGKKLKGVLSFGAALNHNGPDLVYDEIGTPLPKTARAGLGFYLGTHKGINMLLSADYISVKDEKGCIAFGGELMINRIFAINAGYDMGSDLFKKATFGATIRLDHVGVAVGDAFPGKHNAFRLDIATLDDADYFSRTYRGTASHFPTRPAFFEFVSPAHGDSVMSPEVILRWQPAHDRDIFDEVTYHVLMDSDSTKISNILSAYDQNTELFEGLLKNRLLFNKTTRHTFIPAQGLKGGDYYWAVVAMDEDHQARFAQGESGQIAHFNIPLPDIEIRDVEFDYNPYITMDDSHGTLRVTLANNGEHTAHNVKVRFTDIIDKLEHSLDALASASSNTTGAVDHNILDKVIPELASGVSETIEFEWRSTLLGRHNINISVDPDQRIADIDRSNNSVDKILHTVPKGVMVAQDSLTVLQTSTLLVDIPLITEITFDAKSSSVKSEYLQKGKLEPILGVFAERLNKNPDMSIQLQGFADPNSGEEDAALADNRSVAVKNALKNLGVKDNQVDIVPGQVLPRKIMHSDEHDAAWILEERRYVRITTAAEFSQVLMRPMRHKDVKVKTSDVKFVSDITSALPLYQGTLFFESDAAQEQSELLFTNSPYHVPAVSWQPDFNKPQDWLNKPTSYSVSVTDSLGREFKTLPQHFTMTGHATTQRQILSIPLQFGSTDAMADYYWDEIYDYAKETMADSAVRLRFEGHACAIGPEDVNQKLSTERAQHFDFEFKQFLAAKPENFATNVLNRIDQAVGRGESQPLSMQLDNGDTLIGDNNSSIGRKLNRRIELVFYKEDSVSNEQQHLSMNK